jgi:sugar/nucleoside kinase (ribokinase family)
MKLLVIGHSVEDHISSEQKEIVKPGGIYYTASALTSIAPDDKIFLCTYAEKENYSLFSDAYDKCAPEFISFADSIPKVWLTIHGMKERDELYNNVNRNLDIPYARLNEFDGILINMISGFDIELNQLIKIRENFSGIIYMDVHTFSRGLGHHGHRGFRKIEHFNEWAQCLDIIQSNEHEAKTITSFDNEEEIAHEILNCGTKQLIITKGESGAKLYYLRNGELNFLFQSAAKIDAVNKIGLGDVFGAVYFYNYIKTGNLFYSLNVAVNASGIVAGLNGLSKLKSL